MHCRSGLARSLLNVLCITSLAINGQNLESHMRRAPNDLHQTGFQISCHSLSGASSCYQIPISRISANSSLLSGGSGLGRSRISSKSSPNSVSGRVSVSSISIIYRTAPTVPSPSRSMFGTVFASVPSTGSPSNTAAFARVSGGSPAYSQNASITSLPGQNSSTEWTAGIITTNSLGSTVNEIALFMVVSGSTITKPISTVQDDVTEIVRTPPAGVSIQTVTKTTCLKAGEIVKTKSAENTVTTEVPKLCIGGFALLFFGLKPETSCRKVFMFPLNFVWKLLCPGGTNLPDWSGILPVLIDGTPPEGDPNHDDPNQSAKQSDARSSDASAASSPPPSCTQTIPQAPCTTWIYEGTSIADNCTASVTGAPATLPHCKANCDGASCSVSSTLHFGMASMAQDVIDTDMRPMLIGAAEYQGLLGIMSIRGIAVGGKRANGTASATVAASGMLPSINVTGTAALGRPGVASQSSTYSPSPSSTTSSEKPPPPTSPLPPPSTKPDPPKPSPSPPPPSKYDKLFIWHVDRTSSGNTDSFTQMLWWEGGENKWPDLCKDNGRLAWSEQTSTGGKLPNKDVKWTSNPDRWWRHDTSNADGPGRLECNDCTPPVAVNCEKATVPWQHCMSAGIYWYEPLVQCYW